MNRKRILQVGGSTLIGVTATLLSVGASAQSTSGATGGTAQSSATPSPASTETETPGESLSEIVVTGSSLRGVAPVGANIITMDAAQFANTGAQTVAEALADMPSLEGMGASGRATASSSNGGVGISVYVHQLGANGSNSTLVLVDGHRVPASGVTNYLVDPNNVPAPMLERIDVLGEGASAVYGSDAVAGVVNFITRKSFDGVEFHASGTDAIGTHGENGSILAGKTWDGGGVVGAIAYEYDSQLLDTSRPWTNPLEQPQRAAHDGLVGTGATNFGNFNCGTATVQPKGSSGIYLTPTSPASVANAAANYPCTTWAYAALLPNDTRLNGMIRVTDDITPRLSFDGSANFSNRITEQVQSRGTLTATAFGPGAANPAQVNPFYVNPPGVAATQQTIRYDFDELLGPGAQSLGGGSYYWGTGTLDFKLTDSWSLDFLAMLGRSNDYAGNNIGTVNSGTALLALNGTTQTGGSTTTTSIPGFNAITTNLPLTPANALDVWDPPGSNKTSAATLASLVNANSISYGVNSNEQWQLSAQGNVFTGPAGPMKAGFGIEQLNTQLYEYGTRPENDAGASVASQLFQYDFQRTDTAEYVEADIPLISVDMKIPFVRAFETDLAVRHDQYSDFGGTTNPKAALNWDVVPGVRIRADASTSFVAPPLNLVGGKLGLANFSSVAGGSPQGNTVPVSLYPTVTQMGIPGCTAASVFCTISTLQGINSSIGDPKAIAAKGHGWSAGVDFKPDYVPGLTVAATLWNTDLVGGMTAPQFGARVTTASLANALTFYPNCATAAQIAAFASQAPQTAVFPNCVQFTYRSDTSNYLTYWAQGIDLTVAYQFKTSFGTIVLDDNLTQMTKFDEGFAYKMAPIPAQIFSALGTDGFASAFPSVATQMRAHAGWNSFGAVADVYANYTSSYKNVNATAVIPVQTDAAGVYSGQGGDPVKANLTFDLHLGYKFKTPVLGEDTISFVVQNVFNTVPPFFNSTNGYDSLVASPVGRLMTLGVTARL
jgi:iron complex outermembrane receptor protein